MVFSLKETQMHAVMPKGKFRIKIRIRIRIRVILVKAGVGEWLGCNVGSRLAL